LFLGVLAELQDKCIPDASTVQLCEWSDNKVLEETEKVFKKEKNMKKGIIYLFFNFISLCNKYLTIYNLIKGPAFPACISVNNCICHFSPLKSDPDYILKDGDLVKM
jgi:methionine aminopeptidase